MTNHNKLSRQRLLQLLKSQSDISQQLGQQQQMGYTDGNGNRNGNGNGNSNGNSNGNNNINKYNIEQQQQQQQNQMDIQQQIVRVLANKNKNKNNNQNNNHRNNRSQKSQSQSIQLQIQGTQSILRQQLQHPQPSSNQTISIHNNNNNPHHGQVHTNNIDDNFKWKVYQYKNQSKIQSKKNQCKNQCKNQRKNQNVCHKGNFNANAIGLGVMQGLKHSIQKLKNWYNSNGRAENQGEMQSMEQGEVKDKGNKSKILDQKYDNIFKNQTITNTITFPNQNNHPSSQTQKIHPKNPPNQKQQKPQKQQIPMQELYKYYAQPSSSSQPQNSKQKIKIIEKQLIPTQKCIKLTQANISVYFPYQPYQIQEKFMSSVIIALQNKQNALLESPTGTGKTLCLLSSVLSWVDYHYLSSNMHEKVNIIYCSRTHTQLRQVQSQLQKTCFRPTMANFGSRDQFCIKSQFSGIKGRDLMQACSKAVKLTLKAKRKLQIQQDQYSSSKMKPNNNNTQSQKKQKSHRCSFYKSQGEYQKLLDQRYKNQIITSQSIKSQGQLHNFCPYYYPFHIKQKADLIFMPYNYILDVDRIPRYEDIIKNSIIIFDQAHNVPDASCQGRSFSIVCRIFENIELELKKLEYHPSMSPELRQVSYVYEVTRQLLVRQLAHIKKQMYILAQSIYGQYRNSTRYNNQYDNNEQSSYDIEHIYKPSEIRTLIYTWFCPQYITRLQFQNYSYEKQRQIHIKTSVHLSKLVKQANDLIQALKETYDGIFQSLEKIIGFVQKCLELIEEFQYCGSVYGYGQRQRDVGKQWWKKEINHYRISVKVNQKQNILLYEIKLVCLTPSLTFSDIQKLKPRSIILTSGTLSPLDSWQKQLHLKFHIQLTNKHVIQDDQLHLGIICKSINNQNVMNFSYNQLQKSSGTIYKSLLNTIVQFCKIIPNGILTIFPSYKIIRSFRNQLQRDTRLLGILRGFKDICFQEKGSIEHTILNYKNKAKNNKKGAILFCVCRGKVSEGLDFSDQLCRAVIFIGVPYANVKDPVLKQKRQYYDKLANQHKSKTSNFNTNTNNNESENVSRPLSGDQWYTLNTMRSVNQGIGRVIRHINDFGMILMLDNRYQQSKLKNMLPAWSKNNMKVYSNFEEVNNKVKSFYQKMKERFPNSNPIIQQQFDEQFSQIVPMKVNNKKSFYNNYYNNNNNKNQTKREQKSKPKTARNSFQIMMEQARKNAKPKDPKQKGQKKKQIDFL